MVSSILNALEGRYRYYRGKFPKKHDGKAIEYCRNWAHGMYKWAFGQEPPQEWKEMVDKKLRLLAQNGSQSKYRVRPIESYGK